MKFIFFYIFLLALNPFVFAQNDYNSALEKYSNGEFSVAASLFSQSIEKKENIAKSLKMRGACCVQQRLFYSAITDLNSSLQIDSTDYSTYYYAARCFAEINDYKTAINYYEKSIKLNPYYVDNYVDIALCKREIFEFTSAIYYISKAIVLDSSNHEHYGIRASIYFEWTQYDNALADFEKSIELNANADNYGGRGEVLARIGKHEMAIADYTASLAIDPKNMYVTYLKGESLLILNQPENACEEFKKSAALGHIKALTKHQTLCK